uniref:C-type lectin domain-containing protein n=1 Tax=Junco hyemalis TaxID=40217 RepID=A0A8C5JTJ0_JUNHY
MYTETSSHSQSSSGYKDCISLSLKIPSIAGAKYSPCPSTGTTCELCPPGWQLHRGRCYFFSEEARSWEDSQKNCLARKSQLLVFEDEIEMVSLAAVTGLSQTFLQEKMAWMSGVHMDNQEPQQGKDLSLSAQELAPKSTEADKNCAVYRRKNLIQADNCQTLKEWICKKDATLLVL